MTDMRTILVVDDEPGMRAALAEVLARGGFAVDQVASAEEGLARLEQGGVDLLVTDLRLPGMSGLDLLREAAQAGIETPSILMTAYGTVEDAVAAMKLGAFDFLTKPFSPADLLHLATRALGGDEPRAPRAVPTLGVGRPRGRESSPGRRLIVSRDAAMRRILELADSIASSRAPVLVEGESGTGKELLARHLHERGCRRGKPFVAVNCAALPRDLLESELFGHERGAFTGAIGRKIGKFELANGGTILLDEVTEMEPGLQAKLLRVLQEYEIDRVGGTAPVPVDVRVVATTNRRLREMVERAKFREDLYYRLSVIPITLPPLRERRGDVELLIDHFLARFANGRTLAPEARALLTSRPWPGNVRELENALERAALLSRGPVLTPADFDDRDAPALRLASPALAGFTVREMERQLIMETLKRTGNNRTQAARLLGISIRTLRNKLSEYRQRGELEPSALTGS